MTCSIACSRSPIMLASDVQQPAERPMMIEGEVMHASV
jgi:hypothetical protein